MVDPSLLHWAVYDIQYSVTETGIQIVVLTNHSCHLWLRGTIIEPGKHIDTVIERGAAIDKIPRYCFTVFIDFEQQEAGDTWTHTFIIEPWTYCTRRWFYFFGTVDGKDSPSESPLFSYHNQEPDTITTLFYPHTAPLTDSCDGRARRLTGDPETWADIHDGAGTYGSAAAVNFCDINCHRDTDKFYQINRAFILFNTDSIPAGSIINAAWVKLWVIDSFETDIEGATANIFQSWPLGSGNIYSGDYQRIGSTPLSSPKSLASLMLYTWTTFELNAAGLALVIPDGLTELGVREATYDAHNIPPPWSRLARAFFQFSHAEAEDKIPTLKVNYTSP